MSGRRNTLSRRAFIAAAAPAGLALAMQAPPAKPAGRFRAGAAACKITPGKDVTLQGTIMQLGPPEGIHDDLHVRALVLDDGARRLAVVVCDSTCIDRPTCDEAKALIQREIHLPPEHILISATHSHMAVRMLAGIAERHPANAEYRKYAVRQIADAVVKAAANLAPAKIGWGVAPKPELCKNRRWIMKPGTVGPNPFGEYTDQVVMGGRPEKDRLRPAGPTDPDLSILSVQHADGRPLALLANYSIHYAGMVRGQVSADYFGVFAARMEELLGRTDGRPPFVALMSNGTSGNIGAAPGGTFEGIRKVGLSVAETAMEICRKIEHREAVSLAMSEAEIELGVRRPDGKRLEWARQVLAGQWKKPAHPWRDVYAQNALRLAEYPPKLSLKLQAIRVGELGIAACPCETYVETGLAIKKLSPLKPTFTIALANGYSGYLPTPEQFELGGYTTWPAESSCLEVQAEPKIRQAILDLLKKVQGPPGR